MLDQFVIPNGMKIGWPVLTEKAHRGAVPALIVIVLVVQWLVDISNKMNDVAKCRGAFCRRARLVAQDTQFIFNGVCDAARARLAIDRRANRRTPRLDTRDLFDGARNVDVMPD